MDFCVGCLEVIKNPETDSFDIFGETYHNECKPDGFNNTIPEYIEV